jgi:hypothetical protein
VAALSKMHGPGLQKESKEEWYDIQTRGISN